MHGLSSNRIALVVGMPRWGGGIHRDELERLMGVTPGNRKVFTACLMAAYHRHQVCFCGPYVCAVPPQDG